MHAHIGLFWESVNQTMLHFLTSTSYCSASALPGKNKKPINCAFALICCMLFCQPTCKTYYKYDLVTTKALFTVKMNVTNRTCRKAAQHCAAC